MKTLIQQVMISLPFDGGKTIEVEKVITNDDHLYLAILKLKVRWTKIVINLQSSNIETNQ